ncbi:MAG: DNA polymerase-3 subunit delta' [Candidatus Omnitrophota bacterium]|jgi:DNA polymerase-3 subunit delta'
MKTATAINMNIVERFSAMNRRNSLAHAYLFVGPAYVGKSESAVGIAKVLNCEHPDALDSGRYCDNCSHCIKINAGSYPDLHVIESEEGSAIKIEQIRGLIDRIKLCPFMAQKKVFIIKDVDLLTIESSNALLKTLEEPTNHSVLLLTTSVPENILDTVKSRCHLVRFLPFRNEELLQKLTNEHAMDKSEAHFLAYYAQGCLGKALHLKDGGVLKMKNEVIDQFILNSNSDNYVKKVLADKEKVRDFLEVLLSWTRDAIVLKAGVSNTKIIHFDRSDEVDRFQQIFELDDLYQLEEEIVEMFKMLVENFNIKIPLMIIKERLWAS